MTTSRAQSRQGRGSALSPSPPAHHRLHHGHVCHRVSLQTAAATTTATATTTITTTSPRRCALYHISQATLSSPPPHLHLVTAYPRVQPPPFQSQSTFQQQQKRERRQDDPSVTITTSSSSSSSSCRVLQDIPGSRITASQRPATAQDKSDTQPPTQSLLLPYHHHLGSKRESTYNSVPGNSQTPPRVWLHSVVNHSKDQPTGP